METPSTPQSVDGRSIKREKVTIASLQARKGYGPKISRVNCYDYLTARIIDEAGIDMILIGESVGRFVLGYPSVEMVTFDEILHHAEAVRRGVTYAMVIADLPLSSRDMPLEEVVRMGQHLMECGMDAVKIEGGDEVLPQIETLVAADIPVHGTLRFDRSSKDNVEQAKKQYREALAQEQAGCFLLSLAGMPANLARFLTEQLTIPTIGIGSGPYCDGQVVVINDLVGYIEGPPRPFIKSYSNFREQMEIVISRFKSEVENGEFPGPSHWHEMDPRQYDEFLSTI